MHARSRTWPRRSSTRGGGADGAAKQHQLRAASSAGSKRQPCSANLRSAAAGARAAGTRRARGPVPCFVVTTCRRRLALPRPVPQPSAAPSPSASGCARRTLGLRLLWLKAVAAALGPRRPATSRSSTNPTSLVTTPLSHAACTSRRPTLLKLMIPSINSAKAARERHAMNRGLRSVFYRAAPAAPTQEQTQGATRFGEG